MSTTRIGKKRVRAPRPARPDLRVLIPTARVRPTTPMGRVPMAGRLTGSRDTPGLHTDNRPTRRARMDNPVIPPARANRFLEQRRSFRATPRLPNLPMGPARRAWRIPRQDPMRRPPILLIRPLILIRLPAIPAQPHMRRPRRALTPLLETTRPARIPGRRPAIRPRIRRHRIQRAIPPPTRPRPMARLIAEDIRPLAPTRLSRRIPGLRPCPIPPRTLQCPQPTHPSPRRQTGRNDNPDC